MESDATKEKPPMVEEGSRCSDDDNGDYDSDGDGNGDYDGDGDGDGDGALNKLPPDCRDRVFLFLSLSDCLRFAETSRNSLAHSIAEVDRRRREQFLVRPCEEYTVHGETTTPHCAVRTPELPPGDTLLTGNNHHEDHHHLGNNGNDNDNGNGKANGREPTNKNSGADPYLFRMSYSEDLVDAFSNNQEEEEEENPRDRRRTWYELPSVLERLEGLYRAIPSTHPFRDDLRNLVAHLRQVNGEAMIVHGARGNRIDRLSEQWSSVTYAHRMHASLLQRCTVNLDPVPHSSNPNLSFTVTLERYMGDVLAASCLAGHSEYHGRKSTGSYSASGIDKTRIGNDNDNDNDNGNDDDDNNNNGDDATTNNHTNNHTNAGIGFCHNDLLASNIMMRTSISKSKSNCNDNDHGNDNDNDNDNDRPILEELHFIDFEYGGINYFAYDIANHFNEYAGGTAEEDDSTPDYSRCPSQDHKRIFFEAYVDEYNNLQQQQQQQQQQPTPAPTPALTLTVDHLEASVDGFSLANHLVWGLWGVLQAATEGCEDGLDYLHYAKCRFERYRHDKERLLAITNKK